MLNGKCAIITGGSKGMGAAMARDFADHGASVVLFDVDDEAGRGLVRNIVDRGRGRASFVHCDVSDEMQVIAAVSEAIEFLGGLWALVNAAGIAPGAPAEDISLTQWEKVFAVNVRGTFLTNRAVFIHLKHAGGRIINFASGAGVTGLRGKAHYSASKGAVLGWSRTIAKEWGRYGITVNAIAPAIRTPMYEKTQSLMTPQQLQAHERHLAADMPIGGRLGDPDRDLAPVLRFLVSDDSRFITGQTIAIDGGMLMVR